MMDDMNKLSDEALEKVIGGVDLQMDEEGWYVFQLARNESAMTKVYNICFKNLDPNGLVLQAAKALDAPERIHNDRTLKIRIGEVSRRRGGVMDGVVEVLY